MKIAIVHDSITEFGGAERVVETLVDGFPSADIFSSSVDKKIIKRFMPALSKRKLHLSWLNSLQPKLRFSLTQLLSPLIWRSFDLQSYDIIISSSLYLMSNLVNVKNKTHIQYLHTLPKNIVGLEETTKLQRVIPYSKYLFNLYGKALNSTPHLICNSINTQKNVAKIFHLESTVIYPPVAVPNKINSSLKKEFYLCISRIDRTKSLEIAVEAFTRTRLPLLIVGGTVDKDYYAYLKSIAGSSIRFLGQKSDAEIKLLYQRAIAFIFTSYNEDFGIAPIEALAHEVPVIAYFGGGVKETLIEKKTGLFFYRYNSASLTEVLKKFNHSKFKGEDLRNQAKKFRKAVFLKKIKDYLKKTRVNS